jgi:hypothetical protein
MIVPASQGLGGGGRQRSFGRRFVSFFVTVHTSDAAGKEDHRTGRLPSPPVGRCAFLPKRISSASPSRERSRRSLNSVVSGVTRHRVITEDEPENPRGTRRRACNDAIGPARQSLAQGAPWPRCTARHAPEEAVSPRFFAAAAPGCDIETVARELNPNERMGVSFLAEGKKAVSDRANAFQACTGLIRGCMGSGGRDIKGGFCGISIRGASDWYLRLVRGCRARTDIG